MNVSTTTQMLGWGGMLLTILGLVAAIVISAIDPKSVLRVQWQKYVASLDREVRFQLLKTTGTRIALTQLAAFFSVPLLAFFLEEWMLVLMLMPPILILPRAWLASKHAQRVRVLEEQLDSWMLMLAMKAAQGEGGSG